MSKLFNEFGGIFARYVEYAASLAREYGYRIPATYDVGTAHLRSRTRFVVEYRLRLNDITLDVVARFPNADEGVSRFTRDHTAFVAHMQEACARLVLAYAKKHGLEPSPDEVRALTLAGVYDDPRIDKRARDRARLAVYDIIKAQDER